MKRTSLFLGAVLGLVLAGDASAAFNGFIKISTIPGESTHAGEGGWIAVGSGQWVSGAPNLEALRPGTATGGPGSVKFVHQAGSSSTLLRRAIESKQHFGEVRLSVPKSALPSVRGCEADYYPIVLTDVVISSIEPRAQYGGGGASGRASENFSLNFTKLVCKCPAAPPKSLQPQPVVKQ